MHSITIKYYIIENHHPNQELMYLFQNYEKSSTLSLSPEAKEWAKRSLPARSIRLILLHKLDRSWT